MWKALGGQRALEQIRDGTHAVTEGDCLNVKSPYYQIARSIGITSQECVRLVKKLRGIIIYKRGGTIIITERSRLCCHRRT